MSFQDQLAQWQQQAQGVTPEQINQAINRDKKSWDNGCKVDELPTSAEGFYRIRIWPCFETPAEWWKVVWLYQYSPVSSLRRGFSPRNFDKPDIFQDWLDMQLPYQENAPQAVQTVRGAGPKWRVICLIQTRGMYNQAQNQYVMPEGFDPNTLMVLQMPYKKQGFLTAVSPVIQQLAAQRVNPVDLNNGYDAMFAIVGKMRDKTVTNFQFMLQEGPSAAADQATLEKLYAEYYHSLNDIYYTLTEDDLQAYIEYYEPLVELLQKDPQATIDPRKPEARGQALNLLGKSSMLVPSIPNAGTPPPTTPPTPPTTPPGPAPQAPVVPPQQPPSGFTPPGPVPQMPQAPTQAPPQQPQMPPGLSNPTPPTPGFAVAPVGLTPANAGGPPAQPLSVPQPQMPQQPQQPQMPQPQMPQPQMPQPQMPQQPPAQQPPFPAPQ